MDGTRKRGYGEKTPPILCGPGNVVCAVSNTIPAGRQRRLEDALLAGEPHAPWPLASGAWHRLGRVDLGLGRARQFARLGKLLLRSSLPLCALPHRTGMAVGVG